MAKLKDIKTLPKIAVIRVSIHKRFIQEWHFNRRDTFEKNCSAALAEWGYLAACAPRILGVDTMARCWS